MHNYLAWTAVYRSWPRQWEPTSNCTKVGTPFYNTAGVSDKATELSYYDSNCYIKALLDSFGKTHLQMEELQQQRGLVTKLPTSAIWLQRRALVCLPNGRRSFAKWKGSMTRQGSMDNRNLAEIIRLRNSGDNVCSFTVRQAIKDGFL